MNTEIPDKTNDAPENEEHSERPRKSADAGENPAKDQRERKYYYDDAHGYEIYSPDDDEAGN